jgi:ATP-dependent helicase HepA
MFETTDKFDKDQIVTFLNSQREHINNMIKTAKTVASQQMQGLIAESSRHMLTTLTDEIKRLVRLKKINPSIKDEEIEQLKDMTTLSHENIKQAQLRLDAIRFVISS